MKSKLPGEGSPIAEGPPHSHLLRPRPSRLPKPVWVLMQGSLIRSPKVTSASVSPPGPGMTQGGKNGWGLHHIRLGRAPLPPCRSSWPSQTQCPSQPHSWPFIRVGLGIRPGSGDFLAPCHTPGRCLHGEEVQTSPHPHVWAPAQGPREPPE